jgi:glycosyltransferase involved in cell wall biosynthesis
MQGGLAIWYVSKYVAPPGSGSAGGRGYLLMRELAKLGHRVAIVTSDSNHLITPPKFIKPYLFNRSDGLIVCWVRTLKYSAVKSVRRIASWVHFEWRLLWLPSSELPKPDVVVVSSLSLLTLLNGFIWRWRYKCRLIFEVRDIWPLTLTEEGGFKSWNPLVVGLGSLERLGYRYSDSIVGTMPNLGEHVQSVLGYSRQVFFIPMGLDQEALAAPNELPADYVEDYFPPDKFLVAHVGSIGATNALDIFFQCAEVLRDHPSVHFLVVGEGSLREAYRNKYKHLTNLTLAPRVPQAMVQAVLARCDLLYFSVHVSKVWKFGQSLNKVIDYMLAGKPIVASYTGYPSMVNEANCGSYVPAGDLSALRDEILRYADMPSEERERIGSRGREWLLKNRQYSKLAQDYLAIMKNEALTPSLN